MKVTRPLLLGKMACQPKHFGRQCMLYAQLLGRLFSPSDISKKNTHHFLLHFPIGKGSYDHHAKYQVVFPELL